MAKEYCPYCLPTKRKHHLFLHLEYYLTRPFGLLLKPLDKLWFRGDKVGLSAEEGFQQKVCSKAVTDYLWEALLELAAFLKLVRFVSEIDEAKLTNRSLIFLKEAKKRELDVKMIKFLGRQTNEFKLYYGQGRPKRYYYEGIPLVTKKVPGFIDNKQRVKTFFKSNNIPVAPGRLFIRQAKAVRFAEKLGYPLVVKPNSGSLSQHITCLVNSKERLIEAISIAKRYRPDFMVEKHIKGKLYRVTVVGKNKVFVCRRDKANVIGDGIATIKQLIQHKNSDKKRGDTLQKNTTLHIIPIDVMLKTKLKEWGLSLNTILPKGKRLYLSDKYTLSTGCDIINCTGYTHSDNQQLFLKIAQFLKTDLVGIDFICQDITQPYSQQEAAVLEANSLPYIDMHQYPSSGKPDRVAEMVWDIVLDNLSKRSQ